MTQAETIKQILADGRKHCSTEFYEKFIVDYRRRVCDLKEAGLKIESGPCRGECGRNHKANVHRYWIVSDKFGEKSDKFEEFSQKRQPSRQERLFRPPAVHS